MLKETIYTVNDMFLIKRLCSEDIAENYPIACYGREEHIKALMDVATLYCKSVGVVPKCNPAYMQVSPKAKILGLLMLYHSNDVKHNLFISQALLDYEGNKLEWLKWYDGGDYTAYNILLDLILEYGLEIWPLQSYEKLGDYA